MWEHIPLSLEKGLCCSQRVENESLYWLPQFMPGIAWVGVINVAIWFQQTTFDIKRKVPVFGVSLIPMDLYELWMGWLLQRKRKLVQSARCGPTPGYGKDEGQVFVWVLYLLIDFLWIWYVSIVICTSFIFFICNSYGFYMCSLLFVWILYVLIVICMGFYKC